KSCRALVPVGEGENDIAIDPRDVTAGAGEGPQRQIQQSLLLPQNVAAAELDKDVRVFPTQLKVAFKSQFYRNQRGFQVLAERAVVRVFAPISYRIPVRGDCPEVPPASRRGR